MEWSMEQNRIWNSIWKIFEKGCRIEYRVELNRIECGIEYAIGYEIDENVEQNEM